MVAVLNFFKNQVGNILLILVLILVLTQRVPTWINNFRHEGTEAPHFSALNLRNGKTAILPLNKKSIYVFWATWCGPCKVEMNRLQNAVTDGTLPADRIFAISSGEAIDLVQTKMHEEKWSFEFYHDDSGESLSKLGITATPTVLQINASGEIASMSMGIQPLLIYKAESFLKDSR